jgi:Amt family ammonium transporter
MSATKDMKDMKIYEKGLAGAGSRFKEQFSKPPQTTALQKLLIIVATGVFVAFCCLIASLPLNLPGDQNAQYPDAAANSGDTAWMLAATVLAFLSAPALAYLYAHLYGLNTPHLIHTVLIVSAMITFLWILCSFSFVHGKQTHGDKIYGYPIQYYMFSHVNGNLVSSFLAPTIPANIFAIFELCFAILAPTVVAIAVIDRVTIYGFLAFTFVWHLTVYVPVAFITWNKDGWLYTNKVLDFSGGLVTNMLAAITIIVLNAFLDWKNAPKPAPIAAPSVETSQSLLFSALTLWFLSFGINAGKAHAADSTAAQSVVNTIAIVFLSILLTFLWNLLVDRPLSNTGLSKAIIFGLIVSTPCSGYVTVGGAMVIAIITYFTLKIVDEFYLKDDAEDRPHSMAILYGLVGTVSFLFTAFISYQFINPAGQNGLTYGNPGPIRYHLATVITFWVTTPIAVALVAFVTDLLVPLSKAEQPGGVYAPTNVGPFRPESFRLDTTDIYKRPQSTVIGSRPAAEQTQV